jgi:hypothetical protein
MPQAHAFVTPGATAGYSNPVGMPVPPAVNFDGSTVIGNIDFGGTYGFTGGSAGGTVTGIADFAAPDSGQFMPGNVIFGGPPQFNDASVQAGIIALYSFSQTAGGEPATMTSITSGGVLEASSGIPDGGGNEIFDATIDPSFTTPSTPTATFTIDGNGTQSVILNISESGAISFDGIIALTGGITSNQVLFNFDAGDYPTQTGGATLTIDTSGSTTTGAYVDPNGAIIVENSIISGQVFDGGTSNGAIINSCIIPPAFSSADCSGVPIAPVPEPTSLVLLTAGLVALVIVRREDRPVRTRS